MGKTSGAVKSLKVFIRFIPTCVGKTSNRTVIFLICAVHPHVCGENAPDKQIERGPVAVHPHVCGENGKDSSERRAKAGSSPRVWGKHLNAYLLLKYGSVHPHVCGENIILPGLGDSPPGSSPRVWGKRQRHAAKLTYGRFIPTCVGKTSHYRKRSPNSSVHPHVCGENNHEMQAAVGILRFIPTCVGKTIDDAMILLVKDGSSPRVWGKRFDVE